MRETVSNGKNTPIICSGVSGGSVRAVYAYLHAMMGLIIRLGRAPV